MRRRSSAAFAWCVCAPVGAVVGRSDGGVTGDRVRRQNVLTAAGFDKVRGRELDLAFEAAGPERLRRLDSGFAPCRCPTCDATYCRAHLRTEVRWAHDHPGRYEVTDGSCPGGHRRELDD